MPLSRAVPALVSVLLLSACAVADTAPPPVGAEPLVSVPPADTVVAQPEEPQLSLRERWRAPFAVASRGRVAPREEHRVAARTTERPPAAAAPATKPAAAAPSPARPAPAPAASESARTHEVAWGETWYGIARRYAVSPAVLATANPEVDPERIRSGQVLRIPRAAAEEARRTHRVQPGESLWGISRRYGIGMEEIRRANDLADDRVRIGQTLVIPQAEESR